MLLQGFQDCRCISVLISTVKCQINTFFFCVFCIICVVFCKLLKCCVRNRRFSLFLKTQTPVSFCGVPKHRAAGYHCCLCLFISHILRRIRIVSVFHFCPAAYPALSLLCPLVLHHARCRDIARKKSSQKHKEYGRSFFCHIFCYFFFHRIHSVSFLPLLYAHALQRIHKNSCNDNQIADQLPFREMFFQDQP